MKSAHLNERSRQWRRRLVGVSVGVTVLLVVAWWVLTSESFLRRVVLPRVGSLVHGSLTAESIKLSPFSSVELKGVRLTDASGEELVVIGGLKVQFQLSKLLDGIIALDQVQIEAPQVTIRVGEDGSSTFSDWMAAFDSSSGRTNGTQTAGPPVQLDVGAISISGGQFKFSSTDKEKQKLVVTVSGLAVSVDQLRNAQTSAAVVKLNLLIEQSGPDSVVPDSLRATLESSAKVDLNEDLIPGGIESELKGGLDKVTGRFKDSSGSSVQMTVTSTNSWIDSATVSFMREGREVGRVSMAGEYVIETGKGEFDLLVHQLPPLVTELASVALGVDLSLGTLESTNHIILQGLDQPVAAQGRLRVGAFSWQNSSGATPPVDLGLDYELYLDPEKRSGRLDRFNLSVTENEQARARASIAEPFPFAWADTIVSEHGSRMDVSLADVNLDDWQALTGKLPVSGRLTLSALVQSQQAGRTLAANGRASLRQSVVAFGANSFTNLSADLEFDGRLDRFHLLSVRSIDFTLSQDNRPPVSVIGNGTINFTNLATEVQVSLSLPLTNVVSRVSGFPGMLGSGLASYEGRLVYTNSELVLDGKVAGTNLDLGVVENAFGNTAARIPLAARLVNGELTWQIADASIFPAPGELLSFSSSGNLGLEDLAGSMSLTIPGIQTDLINGYLTNHLDGQKLESGEIKISVDGNLQSGGLQKWRAIIASTNVVVVGRDNEQIGPTFSDHLEVETLIQPGSNEFTLTTCRGSIFADGTVCGHLDAQGKIHLNDREATLTIQIRDLDEKALRPLVSRLIGDHTLENVDVTADFDLNYHPDRQSGLEASLVVGNLRVNDPSGEVALDRQRLELLFDAQIVSNRMDITQGQLRLAPTANASNVVDLAGWVTFEDPAAMEGDLALRSQGFDLTAAYDLLSRPAAEAAPGNSVDRERKKIASLQAETRQTVVPFKHLQLMLDFRKLFLRELVASNWVARAIVRTNSVEISPFSLALNSAPISLATTVTSHPDASEFKLALEIEGLALSPVIRTFDPKWDHLATAELFGAADLRGRVAHNSSVWSSTTGHVYAGLTNAHAELLSQEWQHLLQPVALLLQSPKLFSSPIDWFYSHTELGDNTFKIHQYTILSDAYVADVHAVIPLSTNFVDSAFPSVPIDLYLSRNLVTRLKLLAHDDASENPTDYVALPEFLYIEGTFNEPHVRIDKLKTSGMFIGKAGDFIGGTAGDLLKGAGSVTEEVGGWVSGRKIMGADSKLGPVSHGIDFIFRSVGGVFGKTGEAVESGAGAVTGTQVLSGDVMAQRFRSFDWPRQFTNSPNPAPVRSSVIPGKQ